MLIYRNKLKNYSRELRTNMTDSELYLWSKLRMHQIGGYSFNRQKIIGDYIVDFFCSRANLVVEVDGSQYYTDEMIEHDQKRDQYLQPKGETLDG